jgi:hypothetical protein
VRGIGFDIDALTTATAQPVAAGTVDITGAARVPTALPAGTGLVRFAADVAAGGRSGSTDALARFRIDLLIPRATWNAPPAAADLDLVAGDVAGTAVERIALDGDAFIVAIKLAVLAGAALRRRIAATGTALVVIAAETSRPPALLLRSHQPGESQPGEHRAPGTGSHRFHDRPA